MIKTFTENDLLRYLYDEMSDSERDELTQSIATDENLEKSIQELRLLQKQLDGFQMKAPQHVTDRILSHLRASHA